MNAPELPKGWYKEEVIRKSGLSAGKTDIYYYGPDGKKYRSKPQIARELGTNCDLTPFDFKSGNMMNQASIVRRAKGKKTAYDFTKGFRGEANFALPVRQTASIFKQPVTVIRSHPDSQVRHDLKHGPADSTQPRQLFWERSLTGLQCSDIDEETLKCIALPNKIKGIGPDLSTENLLQSIAAALHLHNNSAVVGQSQSTAKFAKDPTVYINTSQPLIQQVVINDDDIRQQESKVFDARKKLEDLLGAIEKSNREKLAQEDQPCSAISTQSASDSMKSASDAKSEKQTKKRKGSPVRSHGERSDSLTANSMEEPASKQAKVEPQEEATADKEIECDNTKSDTESETDKVEDQPANSDQVSADSNIEESNTADAQEKETITEVENTQNNSVEPNIEQIVDDTKNKDNDSVETN